MTLSDIFHPTSLPEFLTDYFGLRALHVAGDAARFSCFDQPEAVTRLAQLLELDLEAAVERLSGDCLGLPPRRAERDLLVLQIAGADAWHLHGQAPDAPSEEATWSERLEAGSALYLPRGAWWRAMSSAPSRHVRLEIQNPTGAGLLLWLANKMKTDPAFDADLPRFAGPAARCEFQAAMRRALMGALRTPDLMERYCSRLNERALAANGPADPWNEAECGGRWIVWRHPRRPRLWRRDRKTLFIRIGGASLDIPTDAAPLLQFLIDHAPAPVGDFYAAFETEFERDEISDFLTALSAAGIVAFTAPERSF